MTKRQKTLMYGGGVCLLLAMVGFAVAAVLNITANAQLGVDIKMLLVVLGKTLLPLLFMLFAAFVSGAGTFMNRFKMVSGLTYAIAAAAALVAALIAGRVSWFFVLLCYGLLCLATLLGEKFPAKKLGLLFAYLPALFLVVAAISFLGTLFRVSITAVPPLSVIWARQCTMMIAELLLGAGFMCIGSSMANAQVGKKVMLVSRIGAIGIIAVPVGMLLVGAAVGLQILLINNGLAMNIAGIFAIILLVLAAILLVAGVLLLPLAILYPLWDKEAIAAKKAAKAEEKKTEAAE